MDDDVKKTFASLAQTLASQYKINANLWGSIQVLVSALNESDPTFQQRLDRQIEAAKSEFSEQNALVIELVRKITEQLKA